MSPVAEEVLRTIRSLPPTDRVFGAEKLLEMLVRDGKLTPLQAHDLLRDMQFVTN